MALLLHHITTQWSSSSHSCQHLSSDSFIIAFIIRYEEICHNSFEVHAFDDEQCWALFDKPFIYMCSLRGKKRVSSFSWVVNECTELYKYSCMLKHYSPLNIWLANTPSHYVAHLVKGMNPSVTTQLLQIRDVPWYWAFWVYLLFRVGQILSSQIIESQQLNPIHYCKALISWLQEPWALP